MKLESSLSTQSFRRRRRGARRWRGPAGTIDKVTLQLNGGGGGGSSSCAFTVTQNVYDGADWWGTITFRNDGPDSASNYRVEFDVPSGKICTSDAVPAGATLTMTGNHCKFTWTNTTPLASGSSKTFNYSADTQSFSAASNVVVTDSICHP